MSTTKQIYFWTFIFLLLIVTVWALQSVMLPFVLGVAIAYLLDPFVEKMDQWGINRSFSTILILLFTFMAIAGLLLLITPVLFKELQELITAFPSYVEKINELIAPYLNQIKEKTGFDTENDLIPMLLEHKQASLKAGNSLLQGLAAGGNSALSILSILALTPLSAFFLMREWPRIMTFLDGLLPRAHASTIKELLEKMHKIVSGFIRGQLIVACLLAVIYAIALKVAGLTYGGIIGLSAGLLSIIPMLGAIFGLVIASATAWFTSGEISFTAIIAGIFIAGQILEGNVLTPKLVGEQVGLHPLWVIFAVMAGGAVMGLTGMFLAVPIVAMIGVLISFFISKYKQTALYTGAAPKVSKHKEKTLTKKSSTKATSKKAKKST